MEEKKNEKNETKGKESVFSEESLNQFGRFLFGQMIDYYSNLKNSENNEKQSEAC